MTESQLLKKKIDGYKKEIDEYTAILQAVSNEERAILEDHIRQLNARVALTEKIRRQAQKKFFGRQH